MGIFLNNCWIMLFFRLLEHIIYNIAPFQVIYPVNFKTSRTPFTFGPSPFPLLNSDLLNIYQGALGRMTIVRVLLGANLSKALHNTSSYSFANDSILCEIHPSDKPDDPIISLKASKSNHFNLRQTTVLLSFNGFRKFKLKQTVLWSEINCSMTVTFFRPEALSLSFLLMTKSNIWPRLWVGTHSCCFKLNKSSNSPNRVASQSAFSSIWKLKSPYIKGSSGHITVYCNRLENSSRKTPSDAPLGGR